jgi:hypothetical protein
MERGKMVASASSSAAVGRVPQLLCLSLHECDKLRVMNLSPGSIAALRAVVQASWKYGVQSEGLYGISYQFKLRGRPWDGDGEQANAARRLMAGVFGFLLQEGWVLRVASDLSKWTWDKDTFYFKQEPRANPDVRVCAMSFNMTDTVRVISGPPEVAHTVRACIQRFWYRGLQRECLYYGEPEFKMHGNPWTAQGTETMQTRMFVGQLIEALDHAGWQVYASIDISTGKGGNDSHYDDLDSWILRTKPPALGSAPAIGIPAPKQSPYN